MEFDLVYVVNSRSRTRETMVGRLCPEACSAAKAELQWELPIAFNWIAQSIYTAVLLGRNCLAFSMNLNTTCLTEQAFWLQTAENTLPTLHKKATFFGSKCINSLNVKSCTESYSLNLQRFEFNALICTSASKLWSCLCDLYSIINSSRCTASLKNQCI